MLPHSQPPPDIPAPPPGPEALRSRGKMTLICCLGGLSILGLLLILAAPVRIGGKKSSKRTEVLNNTRQIGLALFEFEADYGRFPSAATIPDVKSRTSTTLTLGDGSSNQLFRQLLVTRLKSEKPFYAKIPGVKRPDDDFSSDTTALSKGECAFAYIVGLKASDTPTLPVVMTPMVPGTHKFRPDIFAEKAIVLRLDNSATVMQIKPNGYVSVGGGRTLFDPAVWGKVKPDLRWPE